MPLLAIFGSLLVIAALVVTGVACVAFARGRDRSLAQLFAATRQADARAHAKCMLRVFGLECPAIAVATSDELILHPFIGSPRRIPLAHVVLKQETPGTGPYGWWDKRIFHLECPEERVLVLGFADPAPWREIFHPRSSSIAPSPITGRAEAGAVLS